MTMFLLKQTSRRARAQSRAAFTLIELVVAMSMMSVVSISVVMLFGTLMHQWGQNISRANATQAATMALNKIAKEAGKAMAFSASGGPGGLPYFTFPANADAGGNYVPAWLNNRLQFQPGTNVAYCVSNATGAVAAAGTILWRQYQMGGIGVWTPDLTWSLRPGSAAHGSIENLTAMTFTTNGLPAYTVRVSVTVTVAEGKQSNTITLQRDVYLSSHN